VDQFRISGRTCDREMEHVIRAIAVTDPEISVRSDSNIGRSVVQASRAASACRAWPLLIDGGILRIAQRPDFLAFQCACGDEPMLFIAEIEVLCLGFLADIHS